MAIVTRKVSDLSGTEAPEDAFASIIVRHHPKTEDAKRLDALPNELEQFKSVGDLVILEIRNADLTTREMYIKYADFAKVMPDENFVKLPGIKGRIPGTRLNGS